MEDNSTGVGAVQTHPLVAVDAETTTTTHVQVDRRRPPANVGGGSGNDQNRVGNNNNGSASEGERKPWRSGGARAHFSNSLEEPQWTTNLENLIAMYRDKCSQRILVHREAANYYSLRLKYVTIPAALLGGIGTSTVFSTWRNEFCGAPWHQYTSLGAGVCMLGAMALGTIASKSDYSPLYNAHLKSYRNFDKLLKRLTVELCFEPRYRENPREFIQRMLDDYDRFSDESELVPPSVEQRVRRLIAEATVRYEEAELDLERGMTANEIANSEISDEDKAAYFSLQNTRVNQQQQQQAQQQQQSPLDNKRNSVQTETRRRFSAAPACPDSIVGGQMAQHNDRWQTLAQNIRSRGWNTKSRYCKGMPLTAMIEMETLTFGEQISSGSANQTATATNDAITHSASEADFTFEQNATVLRRYDSDPTRTEANRRRAPSSTATKVGKRSRPKNRMQRNEHSHHEMVQSVMASGMVDMAASHPSSHPSSHSGTPPPPTADYLPTVAQVTVGRAEQDQSGKKKSGRQDEDEAQESNPDDCSDSECDRNATKTKTKGTMRLVGGKQKRARSRV